MRKFGATIILAALFLLPVASAAADTSASLEFVVHATVAPARYIVTNSAGQITEIVTNSKLQVLPTVYLDSIKAGNQQTLTPYIMSQYQDILKALPADTIGVIYNSLTDINTNQPTITQDPINPSLNSKLPFLFVNGKS